MNSPQQIRSSDRGSLSPALILHLQATAGNRAVQRLLTRRRTPVSSAREILVPLTFDDLEIASPLQNRWWQRLVKKIVK
jgi:hypothetical protein